MRRKSARNAAKASPEKTVKETESPAKTRRSRRRKRSPSKSSDSEEEVLRVTARLPVADTPDTTTKSHPPSDDETVEEPVWKVTSSDDAPQGEIQKLKICLRRPPPDSPDKSKTRRSKSNSHTEDDATTSSEDKSATRQTRSRGSPFVEEVDEKKGKGKSKGKHKSKIEQSAQLNENETMNIEISENAQVTPQSPSIDKPVDNENDHNKVDDAVIQNVNESAESARITGETGSNQPDNQSTKAVKDTDASGSQLDDDEDDEPLSVIKKIAVVKEARDITSDNLSSEVELSIIQQVDQTPNQQAEIPNQTSNQQSEVEEEASIQQPEIVGKGSEVAREISDQQREVVEETSNQQPKVDDSSNVEPDIGDETSNQQTDVEETVGPQVEVAAETPDIQQSAEVAEKTLDIQQSEVGDETLVVEQSRVAKIIEEDNDFQETSGAIKTTEVDCPSQTAEEKEEISEVEASVKDQTCTFNRRKSPIPESNNSSTRSSQKRKSAAVEENQSPEKEDSPTRNRQSEERKESSEERLSPEKVVQELPVVVDKEHENGLGKNLTEKEDAKDEASREIEAKTPPVVERKSEKASRSSVKRKSNEHASGTASVRRRLIRTRRSPEPSTETSSSPSRVKSEKRPLKWTSSFELPVVSKIDLEIIQTFCPTIEFPEEPDLNPDPPQLKERRRSQAETVKKSERKVSVEYKNAESPEKPTTPQEIEDNSNIIAFNRKISIVDDTASKLKPPPSPAKNPTSEVLFITNLVRPFTLKQLKELLERTGKIKEEGFWTDRIKSKCYVNYDSAEEAEATRNALHGVQWPIGNGKKLIIDFATVEDLEKARNPPAPPVVVPTPEVEAPAKENLKPPVEANPKVNDEKKPREVEKRKVDGPVREWDIGKKEVRRDRSRSRERSRKHHRTPSPIEDFITKKQRKAEEAIPQKLMDDLFLKTKATPSIYWQPLSPEEISTKQQQRMIRMEEHKRRMEESSRMKPREMGRGPAFRRRYD